MSEIIKQSMADIWASIGDVVAPDVEKIAEGWSVEVVPRQYWNWMQNRTDTNLAYLFQHGIPEWDATVEYIVNKSYVTYADVVYKAILTGTNKIPSSQPTYWKVAFATSTAALEALKATTPAADKLPYFNSATTAATTTITPLARTLLDDTTQGEMLTTVGAQPVDATLTALAGVTTATNKLPYFSGVDTATVTDLSAFGRSLIDDADATAARATLVLNNVNNTSDANKPVSTAQQAALDLKAPLASPALTGVPTAPTAPTGTSSTQLATTAFVNAEIANDAPTKTGGGASGSWGISVTGNAARARPQRSDNASWDLHWSDPGGQPAYYLGSSDGTTVQPYAIGVMNVGSATKLATARTINGVPFDGTANITLAVGDAGLLPLTGGTLTGRFAISYVAPAEPTTGTSHMEISSGGANPPSISFNRPGYTAAVITHTGDGINVFSGDGVSKASVSASAFNGATCNLSGRATFNESMTSGWYRSSGAVGWYNETYGGGIHMSDATYVRTYNGKQFLCNNVMRVEGPQPQVQLWDSDHSILRYLYADDGSIGFLNSTGNWSLINDNYGNTTSAGNVTAYSDIRLKKDIELIPDALDKVCALRGVTYERIDSGERQTGVIAQEVQAVLPEAVMTMADEQQTLSVAYGNLVGLLIEAIKELKAEVDVLKQGAK